MHNVPRQLFASALVAAGVLAVSGAQAQYYGTAPQQPPLYPYAAPAGQPYAVEVAPNTYIIRRPAARSYPYVANVERKAPRFDRTPKKADPALIAELRKRLPAKNADVTTKKVVRNAPIVVEHKRFVDDPPRVVERRHVVEDAPSPATDNAPVVEERKSRAGRADGKRVIQADAEITILGPDRMSIRLFRKGHAPRAEKEPD